MRASERAIDRDSDTSWQISRRDLHGVSSRYPFNSCTNCVIKGDEGHNRRRVSARRSHGNVGSRSRLLYAPSFRPASHLHFRELIRNSC